VEIKGSKLYKTQLVQYIIHEGKITGADVHPSNDYLLITSNKGRIFVFRIDTGELRGTILIPLHAKGCCIDPAGLYVIVQVPPFTPKHTVNLSFEGPAL
jgi:WD40 repeat protein